MKHKRNSYLLTMLTAFHILQGASHGQQENSSDSTTVIAPGPDYKMGGFGRVFWGDHYREAWTTPTVFPVLNLKKFAGGLKMVGAGASGFATKRLNFEGADGRTYAFRSIDKDPATVLPRAYRETIAADLVRDQTSASHPAGVLIADHLEDALGIPHAEAHIFVMPDDPALGEYREQFAGILGQVVELPGKHLNEKTIFAGADEVGDGNVVFDLSMASPKERVNTAALITARLLDLVMGDWDRHRWQYRWVKPKDDPRWHPVPEDRDQAFSKLDGMVVSQAHYIAPQLIGFKEKYPSPYNLHFNGREVDRRFLVHAEKSVWDSVAAVVQGRLTDEVIENAVLRLPPEMYALDGAEIEKKLKTRRDKLPEYATTFYNLLARQVEIHTSDTADSVSIKQLHEGSLAVAIWERSGDGKPFFQRLFDSNETNEIRVRMHASDDVAVIEGRGKLPIKVRVIGGEGDDELRYVTDTANVKFYDQNGVNRVTGKRKIHIDQKTYNDWVFTPEDRFMPLDWGHRVVRAPLLGFHPDYGLLLGYSLNRLKYGFRKDPYASKFGGSLNVTSQRKFHFPFTADFRRENSRLQTIVHAQVSQLGVVRFFGFGNDTQKDSTNSFYKIDRWEFAIEPSISREFGPHRKILKGPLETSSQPISAKLGLSLIYSSTGDEESKFIGTLPNLYGSDGFGQLGAILKIEYDGRRVVKNPTKSATLKMIGAIYPAIWDVEDTYGFVDAVASAYIGTRSRLPVLGLRVGGRKNWGNFPYFHSAFVGGPETVRGLDLGRFAGDASIYGGGDLRFNLFKPGIMSVSNFGILAFADAGRVYIDGETPGGWHSAYGGGVWFSLVGPQNTMSLGVGKSDERTAFYLWYGFAF